MATKIFNARQLYKSEFITRRNDLDFTDDRTRFRFYSYKNTIPFHIARWKNKVFISIRLDYIHDVNITLQSISYNEYKNWEVYPLLDMYNGVDIDTVDADKVINALEAVCKATVDYYMHKLGF